MKMICLGRLLSRNVLLLLRQTMQMMKIWLSLRSLPAK
jgi:hypothetical protein